MPLLPDWLQATLLPQMHLSPAGSVEHPKLLSATGFWWRHWWKSRLLKNTGFSKTVWTGSRICLLISDSDSCLFCGMQGYSSASSSVCVCFLPTFRPEAESQLGYLSAPFSTFQKLAWAIQRRSSDTLSCPSFWKKRRASRPAGLTSMACATWVPPCHEHFKLCTICSRFLVCQMIHNTEEKNKYRWQLSPCRY